MIDALLAVGLVHARVAEAHRHRLERPLLLARVEPDRHRRAGAERRQQEIVRRRARAAAAELLAARRRRGAAPRPRRPARTHSAGTPDDDLARSAHAASIMCQTGCGSSPVSSAAMVRSALTSSPISPPHRLSSMAAEDAQHEVLRFARPASPSGIDGCVAEGERMTRDLLQLVAVGVFQSAPPVWIHAYGVS